MDGGSQPSLAHRLLRLARTARHHRADQLLRHLGYRLRQRLPPGPAPPAPTDPAALRPALPHRLPFLDHAPWHRGEEIRAGRWRFLNREARLGFPPRWHEAPEDLLWRFHLHGFSYLPLLSPAEHRALFRSWLESFREPQPRREAWHAYPLSQRLVHGLKAAPLPEALAVSFHRQAAWLERHLEWHLLGNHLLENARALLLAGVAFRARPEAGRWSRRGLELLVDQLDEQVLPDGGHFERSPMYHALMLELVLDVLNVLPETASERPFLEGKARSMMDVLAGLLHPDGTLARFSDTTTDVPPPGPALLAYGQGLTGHEARPRARYPETGYYRLRQGDAFLLVDGGPVGASYLPGHGHADLFSFELDWAGRPWIADTGLYEYVAGPMRDHVRSTRAHNTVTVDGRDQAESWGSFRVARRYPPIEVSFDVEGERCRFRGTFDGYGRLLGDGIVHRRELCLDAAAGQLTVADHIGGRGRHRATSRLHLHPEVHVRQRADGLRLEREGRVGHLEASGGRLELEEGWFCPEFGVRIPTTVVALTAEGELPHALTFRLAFGAGG